MAGEYIVFYDMCQGYPADFKEIHPVLVQSEMEFL